ncbi:DUF4344 domain-containing metallopeptidase [Granulosicoccus sp. 3-233]|uniref:DUF4344 domain-containing metallopeptidase n=1 Tax=Granulosicoccus sp. 3-233 TaxID=3417969 RepID=UPI003D3431C9
MTAMVDVEHRRSFTRRRQVGLLLLLVQFLAACSGYSKRPQPAETVPPRPVVAAGEATDEITEQPAEPLTAASDRPVSSLPEARRMDEASSPGMVLKTFNSQDRYLPSQVEFINGLLRFAQTVTVLSEVEDGPLFDPGTQEIWMPGSFADVIESHFGEAEAPVADVYLHTLVHEVGHVLYDQYDLPLLAREEDAADALASVLLLEYAQDGARVVLNAARMFGLESETSGQVAEADFWSEHSLDIQRYYTTLCHVYGSDPEGQARLVNDDYGLSPERAENCEYEYQRIRRAWLTVLAPYLKR